MPRHDLTQYSKQRTPEERREIARKAGKASAIARQGYKTQRELLRMILETTVDDKETLAELKRNGFPTTYGGAMALAAVRKALAGDVEAARFARDTVGEKPTEAYQLAISDKPIQQMELSRMSDEQLAELADRAEGCTEVADQETENPGDLDA